MRILLIEDDKDLLHATLMKTLGQLADEPKVYDLIESVFDSKGSCPHCSHNESYDTDANLARKHLMPAPCSPSS
jgi:hypothetical protein